MLQDIRDGIRHLLHQPGFVVIAAVTLGLGIGANTAMFSLIKAVLLQPLPYGDPERIVIVWNPRTEAGDVTHLSAQEVYNYGRDASSLEGLAGYEEYAVNLTGGQEPERVRAAAVTPNLFTLLRVQPLFGRPFVEADGANVIVLGYGVWQRRFGGEPGIVGREIQVNGRPRTVLGVMPPAFRLPSDYRTDVPTEAWTPNLFDRANLGGWGSRSLFGVGRLRNGMAAGHATSELELIGQRWIKAGYVVEQRDRRFLRAAIPIDEFVTGRARRPLQILLGTVALVLLIAVANVTNLMLARADIRARDVAIRAALGAARGRLVRQMLVESALIGAAGGVLGLLFAWMGIRVLTTLRPANLPRVESVSLDLPVLALTAAIAIVTGLLFGLAPALQFSRPDLTGVLRDGGRSGTPGRARHAARRVLVVAQTALSVVLVLGAGLLARSLVELNRIDLGFTPASLLTARVILPESSYPQPADVVRFFQEAIERLEGLPGVSHAGAIRILPLSRNIGDWSITLESRPHSREENPNGDFQSVTPHYFEAMGMTLVAGRFITDADRENAPLVVVINEPMAKKYWPEGAIGKRFHMGTLNQPWMTIVGVVRTVRHNAVVEEPRSEMYLPHAQLIAELGSATRGMTFAIKTDGQPLGLAPAVRETIREMDPALPVAEVRTMEDVTAAALAEPRFTTLLLAVFAGLALTLAAIGIYGTISLVVAERAQEIGIRMALGARRGTIARMVLSQGGALAAAGIVLGTGSALFVTRLLGNLLYEVSPLDPVTFLTVPVLLGVVALAASVTPALRAAALDPLVTLRKT